MFTIRDKIYQQYVKNENSTANVGGKVHRTKLYALNFFIVKKISTSHKEFSRACAIVIRLFFDRQSFLNFATLPSLSTTCFITIVLLQLSA